MSEQFLQERYAEEVGKQRALLLSAAGAGIAFALHQTADARLEWWLIPAAAAVACWAGSFACGIFNSHAKQAAIKLNIAILRFEKINQQERADALALDFKKCNDRATRTYLGQLWGLLAGAVFYVAGHVLRVAT
jgi:hypothetical protein